MSVEQKRSQLLRVTQMISLVEASVTRGNTYLPIDTDYYTYYQPIDTPLLLGMRHIVQTLQEETQTYE